MLADLQILIFWNAISSSAGRLLLFSFCTYLHQQFFNRLRLGIRHYKIPAQQQAAERCADSNLNAFIMFRDHKVYMPHPALKELVNNIVIQTVQLDTTLPVPIFPMPPIQEQAIFFYPYDPVHIKLRCSEKLIQLPRSLIVARRIDQLDIIMGYNHLLVKVGLQPGALFRLLGISTQELGADGSLNETDYLLDKQVSFVTEQLNEANSFDMMVAIIQTWLFTRLKKLKAGLPIDKVLPAFLQKHTPENISEIASLSCVSIRQLERLYTQRIGLTPKFYARLVRFTKAWIIKEANPALSWTKLAYKCGYFDQMHLIHDFKQFAGTTPSVVQKT